jgi:hypothetical protein
MMAVRWDRRAARASRPARRRISGLFAVLLVGGLSLTACTALSKVSHAIHTVEGNKTTIDAFTNKIQSGEAEAFEATYSTTGSAPAKVVYAVQPPNEVAFSDTPSGSGSNGGRFDFIVNSSGDYNCEPPSGSGSWTCEKLSGASASEDNALVGFYTPSHWVTFLKDASIALGLAGDKVSNSTMSVNGFSLTCVDVVASGVSGTSTICTTQQNILGYVKAAGDSTSFEIDSYSASPSASEFQLPPGAKVVVPTTTTSAP